MTNWNIAGPELLNALLTVETWMGRVPNKGDMRRYTHDRDLMLKAIALGEQATDAEQAALNDELKPLENVGSPFSNVHSKPLGVLLEGEL